jgi:hypothetical protein
MLKSMWLNIYWRFTISVGILIALCLTAAIHTCKGQSSAKDAYAEISSVLFEQQKHWNAGDIDKFMLGYWQSEDLSFVGSNGVTKGWHNILANYKIAYPNKAAMGQLEFTIIEIKLLEPDHALMLGQYKLFREKDVPVGFFTLIWAKIDDHWCIIMDHTSS